MPETALAVTGNVTVVNPSAGWAVYLGPDVDHDPLDLERQLRGRGQQRQQLDRAIELEWHLVGNVHVDQRLLDGPGLRRHRLLRRGLDRLQVRTNGAGTPARLPERQRALGHAAFEQSTELQRLRPVGHPGDAAAAVTGNLTVVDQTAGWALYLGPASQPWPTTSTINFAVAETRGNGLAVALVAGWRPVHHVHVERRGRLPRGLRCHGLLRALIGRENRGRDLRSGDRLSPVELPGRTFRRVVDLDAGREQPIADRVRGCPVSI